VRTEAGVVVGERRDRDHPYHPPSAS
jgi:hypothetical protein